MKYRRQLMSTMFALSLFAISPSALAAEDFLSKSKVSQYEGQIHMKSYGTTNSDFLSDKQVKKQNKKQTKKNKRFQKMYNQQ